MNDSVVVASVLDKTERKSPKTSIVYYWYYAGKIFNNKGNYSGKLLTDMYEVFDDQRRLITKGRFLNGVKVGTWVYWYKNGNIRVITAYKNGERSGLLKRYDINGKLLEEINFKKDIPDGKCRFYLNDSSYVVQYKSGMIIPSKSENKINGQHGSKVQSSENPAKSAENNENRTVKRNCFSLFNKSGKKTVQKDIVNK